MGFFPRRHLHLNSIYPFRHHQITLPSIFPDQLPLQKYNNVHRSQDPFTAPICLSTSHARSVIPTLPNPNTEIIPLPLPAMCSSHVSGIIATGCLLNPQNIPFPENHPQWPCWWTRLCPKATVNALGSAPDSSWATTTELGWRQARLSLDCSSERQT